MIMATKILICLAAVITPTLCNVDTYVYTTDCLPPFNQSTTTLGPGLTTLGYDTLAPIERCCPQCEKCKHVGGTCQLKWALELYTECICDFTPVHPCRDYSCQCCITCQDDTCSDCSQTGGNCRTKCRWNELEDISNLCSYPKHHNESGCKCCKKCESTPECTDAWGQCVTDPANCPRGTYPSTGCCGGCTCCKPVLEPVYGSSRCFASEGATCSETEEGCPEGTYACANECSSNHYINGLDFPEFGYCCISKNAPSGSGRSAGKFLNKIGNKIHPKSVNKFQHSTENLVAEQAHKIQVANRHPRQLML